MTMMKILKQRVADDDDEDDEDPKTKGSPLAGVCD